MGKSFAFGYIPNPVLVGGGTRAAPMFFCRRRCLNLLSKPCDVIIGARNKDLILCLPKRSSKSVAKNLYLTTDDGHLGARCRFVTDTLKDLIEQGKNYDLVFAVEIDIQCCKPFAPLPKRITHYRQL